MGAVTFLDAGSVIPGLIRDRHDGQKLSVVHFFSSYPTKTTQREWSKTSNYINFQEGV